MKRHAVLAISVLLLWSLYACGSETPEEAPSYGEVIVRTTASTGKSQGNMVGYVPPDRQEEETGGTVPPDDVFEIPEGYAIKQIKDFAIKSVLPESMELVRVPRSPEGQHYITQHEDWETTQFSVIRAGIEDGITPSMIGPAIRSRIMDALRHYEDGTVSLALRTLDFGATRVVFKSGETVVYEDISLNDYSMEDIEAVYFDEPDVRFTRNYTPRTVIGVKPVTNREVVIAIGMHRDDKDIAITEAVETYIEQLTPYDELVQIDPAPQNHTVDASLPYVTFRIPPDMRTTIESEHKFAGKINDEPDGSKRGLGVFITRHELYWNENMPGFQGIDSLYKLDETPSAASVVMDALANGEIQAIEHYPSFRLNLDYASYEERSYYGMKMVIYDYMLEYEDVDNDIRMKLADPSPAYGTLATVIETDNQDQYFIGTTSRSYNQAAGRLIFENLIESLVITPRPADNTPKY